MLCAALAFLGAASMRSPARSDDGPDAWTVEQWAAWRNAEIRQILTPTVDEHGVSVLTRNAVIQRCVPAFMVLVPELAKLGFEEQHPELRNFARFVRAQAAMAHYDEQGVFDHGLGYDITDREYWRRSAADIQLPALLRNEEFLKDMSAPATYKAAMDLIDEQNRALPEDRKWIVMEYRSRFLRSAEHATYGRLLIVVPNTPSRDGGAVDRWIQFAISVPDSTPELPHRAEVKSVSVVAVHRDGPDSTRPLAYMADFIRETDRKSGQIELAPSMLTVQNLSKNCYECHKSPVLPIHPKTQYRFDAAGSLVTLALSDSPVTDALNSKIAAYGNCEMAYLNTSAFGPGVGASGIPRSDEFIRRANPGKTMSADSVRRIRAGMECGRCHDAVATLNYPETIQGNTAWVSFEQKKGLAQTYVEEGWMPPKNTLTPDERIALWRALRKEYFDPQGPSGTLVDWLKEK